jgi:hypothetical protein
MSLISKVADKVGLGPPTVSAVHSDFDLEQLGYWQNDHFTERGEREALNGFATGIGQTKWRGRRHDDQSQAQLIKEIKQRVLAKERECTGSHSGWNLCPHELQITEEIRKAAPMYSDEAALERTQVVGNALIRQHQYERSIQAASFASEASTRVTVVDGNEDPHPYDVKLAAAGVTLGSKFGKVLADGCSRLSGMSDNWSESSRRDW